jgi:hypothetical protein
LLVILFIIGCPTPDLQTEDSEPLEEKILAETTQVLNSEPIIEEPVPEVIEPPENEPVIPEPIFVKADPAEDNIHEPNLAEILAAEPEIAAILNAEPVAQQPNIAQKSNEPNMPVLIIPDPNIAPEPNITEPILPEPNVIEPKLPDPNVIEPNLPEPNLPQVSTAQAFHDKVIPFFEEFVNDDGSVNYRSLKRKRIQLIELLRKFENLSPEEYGSWPKEDKIAFWINAYNLQLTKIILSNYPIKSSALLRIYWGPDSIRHINGIWDSYKFTIMDEEFTLNEIETRFFKSQFDDPRIFLAISKASKSGPPMQKQPYFGKNLDQQLNDQVTKFLTNPLAFRIDRNEKIVYISPILGSTWYAPYFLDKHATNKKFKDQKTEIRAVLNFITNYLSPEEVNFLRLQNYSVRFIPYNWNLNE